MSSSALLFSHSDDAWSLEREPTLVSRSPCRRFVSIVAVSVATSSFFVRFQVHGEISGHVILNFRVPTISQLLGA